MRVLHVFYEFKFSGAETMYRSAIHSFREQGVEALMLATAANKGSYASKFEQLNVPVLHLPLLPRTFSPFRLFHYMSKFRKLILREKIDVVHIHRSTYSWFFAFCAWTAGKKAVRSLHNVFRQRKITWLKGFLERLLTRKLFRLHYQSISQSVFEHERDYFKNPTTLVRNWIDQSVFSPAKNAAEKSLIRKKLGLAERDWVMISVGNCNDIKNHDAIIYATSKLRSKNIPIKYLHIGAGSLEVHEKDYAKSLKVSSEVMFLGSQEKIREYLIASDVFVMSSRYEGVGISAVEAMACGIPCVLYNVPGLRDLIPEEKIGYLIRADKEELSHQLLYCYNNSAEALEKARQATGFVQSHFSMKQSVSEIVKIYKQKIKR